MEQVLALKPLTATTTDHFSQSIAQTIDGNQTTYWSSTGSIGPQVDDYLLYSLPSLYQLSRVEIMAGSSLGGKSHPPREVIFMVGTSPEVMVFTSNKYNFSEVSKEGRAVFILDEEPQGNFLKIHLRGKKEKVDHLYYTFIRSVKAYGIPANDQPLLPSAASSSSSSSSSNVAKKEGKLEEKDTCVVCFEKKREAAIIPCGHFSCCMACIEDIKARGGLCPECRGAIVSVLKVSLFPQSPQTLYRWRHFHVGDMQMSSKILFLALLPSISHMWLPNVERLELKSRSPLWIDCLAIYPFF